ncbi:multiple C2 and transmembrane domain-containing protein 1 isoform 2-T3 [Pholidichthys leucotaenia]
MQHSSPPCTQVPQNVSAPPYSESKRINVPHSASVPHNSGRISEPRESEVSLVQAFKESLAMTRLPAPEPFVFTGDPLKFTKWTTCFKALIEISCTGPAHKLFYLKKYISGETLSVLEGTFYRSDEEAYTQALDALSKRYGHPFVVQRAFRGKLSSWPKIGPKDSLKLREFSDFLISCKNAMPHVQGLGVLDDCEENQKLLRKLPNWATTRWNRHATKTLDEGKAYPGFEEFTHFVAEEARIACNPISSLYALKHTSGKLEKEQKRVKASVLVASTNVPNYSKQTSKATSQGGRGSKPSSLVSQNKKQIKCICCQQDHFIYKCDKFAAMPLKDRKKFVMDNNMCFSCLRVGHISKSCRQKVTCNICRRSHPSPLHEERPQGEKPEMPPQEESASTVACSVKQQQSVRLSDLHRKSQLWRGIVSIALIEGRNLTPMDPNGLSDPYVKFRLGPQKYKSKTVPKTLSPQWREQFDLHLYEETGEVLEITVWDKDTGRRDDFIGRCHLDLSTLAKEHTHHLELPLEDWRGFVVLLVTLTASAAVSIADLSVTPLDDPQERREILKQYGMRKSFSNMRDVGIVQVKVLRAEGLMAADVTGKSDPFCVLELNNDRLQTHTVYKNLNPEWNKVFTFNVKDIHSVLEVTVFDEDRDRSADFLGKIAIPLLKIRNAEQKAYLLKNKELTGPTKGFIFLEIEVIYNTVKAAMRTIVPAEQKYIEEEPKVSKQLLQQNFNRAKRCIMVLISFGTFINSCFEWESAQRSIISFVLFVVVVWNFELYMLPLALLLLLVWNYFFCSSREAAESMDATFEWEDEDEEKEDKDSEHKGFMDKLYAIQDVFISVQNGLDEVASFGERVKNTFNWTVPFLSWLAITALCLATFLLYLIPLRYLVLAWGVNKFTKKLRDPYMIDNNELLDFLSRVPSDVQVMQYRELKADPGQSPNKRRRTNLS